MLVGIGTALAWKHLTPILCYVKYSLHTYLTNASRRGIYRPELDMEILFC